MKTITSTDGQGIVRIYSAATLALITEFDSSDRLKFRCLYEGDWKAETPTGARYRVVKMTGNVTGNMGKWRVSYHFGGPEHAWHPANNRTVGYYRTKRDGTEAAQNDYWGVP